MRRKLVQAVVMWNAISSPLFLQAAAFQVVVLGCGGGPREDNLSCYLLAKEHSNQFIALDAGTLLYGITKAMQKGSFQKEVFLDVEGSFLPEAQILRDHVKAYCISHAHLDHVAGLMINSTLDCPKPLFGLDPIIDFLQEDLFNGKVWPNFSTEGNRALGVYQYVRLKEGRQVDIPQVGMRLEPFVLSHPGEYVSTAFLLESEGSYVIYFGDTSPDELEPKKRLDGIWKRLVPLAQRKKLKGIFLECSYLYKPKNGS